MKLLSIILPVYNTQDYLIEAVESLISFNDLDIYELILVNDGSRDNCGKLCDELALKYPNIRVIHKENQGLSMARNDGIEIARGQYITFVDSDDFYEQGGIERVLQELKENTDIDLFFIQYVKYYDKDNITSKIRLDSSKINNRSSEQVLEYLATLNTFYASACTKIIKKDILTRNHLFFKEGIYSEDIDWFLRLIEKDEVKTYKLIDINYYYRQARSGSITNSVSDKHINDLYNIIVNSIERLNLIKDDKKASIIKSFLAFELMILIYLINNIKNKKELVKKIRKIKYLFKYSRDKKVKLTSICVSFLGIGLTSRLLKLIKE